jgi:hypothetical protein
MSVEAVMAVTMSTDASGTGIAAALPSRNATLSSPDYSLSRW